MAVLNYLLREPLICRVITLWQREMTYFDTQACHWWLFRLKVTHCYRPQTKFAKVMFLQVSVILSTGEGWVVAPGGACVVAPGGACVVAPGGTCVVGPGGGMRGCSRGGVCGYSRGACMVALGGHAWLLPGGCMCGCSGGACVVALGGMCGFLMRYGQWVGGMHPTGMHSCLVDLSCYCPPQSWGKVLFLHMSVILFTGGWYPSMHCRWYPSMPCSRSLEGGVVCQHAL